MVPKKLALGLDPCVRTGFSDQIMLKAGIETMIQFH
jgi:hypothetical protein